MGFMDKGKMLWKAQQVQKELKKMEVEAASNNGWVTVVVNGELRIKSVKLSDEAMGLENKNDLERTIQQTITEALTRTQSVVAEKTRDVMKDMGMNLPGF